MRRFAALLPLAIWACRPASTPRPPERKVVLPTVDELRRDLYAFSDDSFRGRQTGSLEAQRAARFIAGRLAALGLEPAGDSGYYQRVPMLRATLGEATSFKVTTAQGATTLALGADIAPLPSLGRDAPLPRSSAEGDMIFAGFGIPGKGAARDGLGAIDVAGKVVVVVNGAPAGTSPGMRAALEARGQVGERLRKLIPLRPAAIVVLLQGEAAKLVPQVASQLSRPSDEVALAAADTLSALPMIVLATLRPGSPFLPSGWPADETPQPLRGRHFSARVDLAFTGYNVVGIVRGADSAMNRTYVAYGAHYDHIGVEHGARGDSINNGADDDGSGTVSLLALARAFQSAPRPRRSVLFVWHVGEEQGLLGSDYFTEHSTVPIDSVVAQLNVDMVGRNSAEFLYIVGPLVAPHAQSRVLGGVVDSVNASLPQPFQFLRDYDRPTDPEQLYYRSDHYNYARKGVPIIFFTSGLHEDYHKPSDEPSKIDYAKLAHVDQLLYEVGVAVANRETRPRV